MLKIQNIEKIVSLKSHDRVISSAGEYDSLGEPFFTFEISAQHDGIDYNRSLLIVLSKMPDVDGLHRMFCMGLQISTQIKVTKEGMSSHWNLASSIGEVLLKTENYYKGI